MKGPAEISAERIPEVHNVRRPVVEQVFARRAARFRSLAPGTPICDYLRAMACLADAQHAAARRVRFVPDNRRLKSECPFHFGEWVRDDSWQGALQAILSDMKAVPLPPQGRAALASLSACSSMELESAADALLAGCYDKLGLSSATFLGAALQVYWTALAGMSSGRSETQSLKVCPLCSSLPVAGVVLGDSKLRYLVCGLCSTEWYLPRLTCAHCGTTEGISYFVIEDDRSGAKAECCAQCQTYLKLFYLGSSPAVEAFADDAATLALDTLIAEEGFSRTGPNFYLLPGGESIVP